MSSERKSARPDRDLHAGEEVFVRLGVSVTYGHRFMADTEHFHQEEATTIQDMHWAMSAVLDLIDAAVAWCAQRNDVADEIEWQLITTSAKASFLRATVERLKQESSSNDERDL